MNRVFGRTNWDAPSVWLRPLADTLDSMSGIAASVPDGSVVAVSGAVAGHAFRGRDVVHLVDIGFDYETAGSSSQTVDTVSAALLQAMTLIGAPRVGLAVLPVRQPLWGGQIEGALRALESARQDGVVRFVGLRVAGPWPMVEPVWRRHDAFEFALAGEAALDDVAAFARSRRVGVVGIGSGDVRLVDVRSADEVLAALGATVGS